MICGFQGGHGKASSYENGLNNKIDIIAKYSHHFSCPTPTSCYGFERGIGALRSLDDYRSPYGNTIEWIDLEF